MTSQKQVQDPQADRAGLMEQHRAARDRRDSARLGSDEFRAAAEEVARIEVAIAGMEEPSPTAPPPTAPLKPSPSSKPVAK